YAALAVMALLISDLERAIIRYDILSSKRRSGRANRAPLPPLRCQRTGASQENEEKGEEMTLPVIDRDGRATRVAADAQAALASGDTLLASQKYGEAGALLERKIPNHRKQTDKHL